MNKTYNMNLGGMPFQIDDEAYERLNAYLSAVKRKFSHVQGNHEIVEDIEARMAEMFQENLDSTSRKIVSLRDVDAAIETMGRPEEFDQGFEDEETYASSTGATASSYRVGKKLFRDPDDKVLGGVISGLSQYFGLESPTLLRIIWVALPFLDIFFAGISTTFVLLAYVVLWIAVPKAVTATQKMQMRGERVNLDNIERNFNEGIDQVKKNLNSEGTRNVGRGLGEVIGALAIGFGKLLLAFGLFIAGIIALSLIIAFFAGIIGVGSAAPFLSQNIFGNSWMGWLGIIGLFLICFAPLVFIITLLLKILFKNKTNMPAIAFGTLGAFILGWILTTFTGLSLAKDFSEESSQIKSTTLEPASELYLFGNNTSDVWDSDDFTIGIDKELLRSNVDLKILPSIDSTASIQIKKYAKGRTEEKALALANGINYNYQVEGNRLTFDEQLSINDGDLWRAQEVDAELRVPENTVLHFDESVDGVLRYAKIGGERYSDWRLSNHGTWKYMDNQLIPLDSEGNPVVEEENEDSDDDEFRWEGDGVDISGERDHVEINLFGKEVLKVDVLETEDQDRVRLRIGDKKTLEIDVNEDGKGKIIDIDEE